YGGAPWWITETFNCVDGRAAVTFVTLAGIGAVLLSRDARASDDPARRRAARTRLFYRSMFVLALGVFNFQVWPGDILHFYGLYMATGALVLYAKPGRLLLIAACAVLIMYAIAALFPEVVGYGRIGHWYPDYLTVRGFFRNEFINGGHAYFPWVAYYLFGMWLAQQRIDDPRWRVRALAMAFTGIALCELVRAVWFRTEWPIAGPDLRDARDYMVPDLGDLFRMGSLQCTAVAIIILCLFLAEARPHAPAVGALAATGRMALTHYLAHTILVLGPLFIVGQLDYDHSRWTSLALALAFCTAAVTFSTLWKRRYRQGPLEAIMRRVCG
ncbi:MAG: DUF418 domain-containing protein, partial [Candidatus Hydrogenedentes bacterium]|nr:DUF418 domain-containing protein [Candidatus Hydrogenedentota bacterium]